MPEVMITPDKTIVAVDDEPANLVVLSELLEPEGYQLLCAKSGNDALRLVREAKPVLILLDVLMPELNGYDVSRRLKADPDTAQIPIIFITGRADLAATVEGFRAGAVDYVVKPFAAEEVVMRVNTHADIARTRKELARKNAELAARVAELREAVERREAAEAAQREANERLSILTEREARRWNVAGLVGRSSTLAALLREVERLQAYGRVGVLLCGESGTGKELVARALHDGSPRAAGPFIPVNCVAVPGELMESMFFGHVRGAFTGATADRKGFFELASGGTLFLDEIGDMPADLQAKLLRVLEDGMVTPVGSANERKVDVRVVAATNADLEAKIAEGVFRQDLYFRLARTTLRLPPLRERREDIPLLAAHFIERSANDLGLPRPSGISRCAFDLLNGHAFPGNVRELRNLIENAVIACSGGPITAEHFRLGLSVAPTSGNGSTAGKKETLPMAEAGVSIDDLPWNLEAAERALIKRAIHEAGGNISKAARMLGIHRMQIYRTFDGTPGIGGRRG